VIIYLEDLGPVEELNQKEIEYEIGVSDKLEAEGHKAPQEHYLPLSYALQGNKTGERG